MTVANWKYFEGRMWNIIFDLKYGVKKYKMDNAVSEMTK